MNITGTANADNLIGTDGADNIFGGGGIDTIYGGSGNDTLNGQGGKDMVFGGKGDDYFILQDPSIEPGIPIENQKWGADTIIELPNEGIDSILYSGVGIYLPDNVENIFYTTTSNTVSAAGNSLANLIATNTSDYVILQGHEGNDTLIASYGNDSLYGQSGADSLYGGSGNDSLYGDDHSPAGFVSDPGNDTLLGGDGNDSLWGDFGNDLLIGGSGIDSLIGGTGDDIYDIESDTQDVILEYAGEGNDAIKTSLNVYDLTTANVENLISTATGAHSIAGNASNNVITDSDASGAVYGQDGNDTLWGNDGDDTLYGGNGDDYLLGGAGANVVRGGAGNDRYYTYSGEAIIELDNEGIDTAITEDAQYVLSTGVENLILEADNIHFGIGNLSGNLIQDSDATGILSGGGGNDTVLAGGGNDVIKGGIGADELHGDAGDDDMEGDASNIGSNTLGGSDTLFGGAGNDKLNDSSLISSDLYISGLGQGTDTVRDLGGSADQLRLSGPIGKLDVWLSRAINTTDLRVSIIGSTDSVLIKDFFADAARSAPGAGAVEQLTLDNGSKLQLTTGNADLLIQAMSGMTPPASSVLVPSQIATQMAATWV